MIRALTIKNYKSILDHTIELGRFNVFIGENGCGKTNILEAVAMGAAALTDKLSVIDLLARGIRVAKPSMMRSSFIGSKEKVIDLSLTFVSPDGTLRPIFLRLSAPDGRGAKIQLIDEEAEAKLQVLFDAMNEFPNMEELKKLIGNLGGVDFTLLAMKALRQNLLKRMAIGAIDDFAIYNASSLALRGLQTMSWCTPLGLGLYGENLDVAISALKAETRADLIQRAKCVSWLDNVLVDTTDELKHSGHKLGQSQSNLYFQDRFMKRKNKIFSAESVNEGVLHILFYLTLFTSDITPTIFGIDNIEAALNPQLCRDLIKQLVELSVKHEKQALITTHNPAILDGLNLHDDEQRLFVVSRDDNGHTVTKRIRLKPNVEEGKYKLSEMWMRGYLGGLPPQRF